MTVEKTAVSELPSLLAIYKDIHSHPELSTREEKTSALVAKELRAVGCEVTENFGKYDNPNLKCYGVVGIMKALANELGIHHVRVNTVHPGVIDTPIWGKIRPDLAAPGHNAPIDIEEIGRASAPLGRVGKPQDIANGVLFLASDASSYITGTELVIDGGITGGAIARRGPLAARPEDE